jgi:hypothetical protein
MSSVNDIINQINNLSGFNIPSSSVNVTSGSLSPAPYTTAASYVATATAPSGTISTAGIAPGSIITSEQILRIINALNGVSSDTIIISGSLISSGLNEIDGTLALPFIQDGNYLFVTGGFVTGSTGIASSSFATSASYAITSSLPLLGIVTASVNATTITFRKGDETTFDLVIAQSGSVESASYATFAENASTSSIAISSSYALTASFALNAGSPFSISTGSVVASVNTSTASIFLIQSASVPFLNIASNSTTVLNSDLFIIKGFTSQQPVLTVSGSIVNIATHSIDPSGNTDAGSIYFTSGAMYIGLE